MDEYERHEIVKDRLRGSHDAVEFVAELLKQRGYEEVTVLPYTVADRYEDRMQHRDNGDISMKCIVEVKHLGINFSCAGDWPFGKHVMVDNKWKYDNKPSKPIMYINVSNDFGAILTIVPIAMSRKFYTGMRFDRGTQREEMFYLVDKSNCLFTDLRETDEYKNR